MSNRAAPLALIVVFGGYLLWSGYRLMPRGNAAQARRHWALVLMPFLMIAMGLTMAWGVDHGVYKYLGPGASRVYFALLMAGVFLGPLSAVGVITWLRWKARRHERRDPLAGFEASLAAVESEANPSPAAITLINADFIELGHGRRRSRAIVWVLGAIDMFWLWMALRTGAGFWVTLVFWTALTAYWARRVSVVGARLDGWAPRVTALNRLSKTSQFAPNTQSA